MARNRKRQKNILTPFAATYAERRDFPDHVDATIYMDGLVCLFFSPNECTVCALVDAPHHTLKFEVWENHGPPDCRLLYGTPPDNPSMPKRGEADALGPDDVIKITVTKGSPPVEQNDVSVFMPGPGPLRRPGGPNEKPSTDHPPYPYGYSLDIEGDQFYNAVVDKDGSKLKPRFQINNGVFYAHAVSVSTFGLQLGTEVPKPLDYIALAVGAAISLDDDEHIEIWRNPSTVLTLDKPASGVTYDIGITNNCYPSASGTDECTNIDFSLYYNAITGHDNDKYKLVRTTDSRIATAPQIGCVGAVRSGSIVASDRAPCTVLGFGQSSTPP